LTGQVSGDPHDVLYWRWMYQAAIRAGKWKLLMVGANQRFLFDMDQPLDQLERENLIDQYPDLARTLERRLTAWANQQKPPGLPTATPQQEASFALHFKE